MAFQDERKRLSWSLMVLLSLALAGCGGDSSSSSASGADNQQTSTVSESPRSAQPIQTHDDDRQASPDPDAVNKSVADGEDDATPSNQVAQPGEVIENPIFADPIPVPVPEDAQPDPVIADDGENTSQGDAGTDDDQEVAAPEPEAEPEPEQPEPVAQRPTLQWDSPLTRVDGSKLYPGEISGYRVYYRLRHLDEFQSLEVEGPDSDSLKLDNFEPGAYEFAVSTIDVDGLESRRSDPVTIDLI